MSVHGDEMVDSSSLPPLGANPVSLPCDAPVAFRVTGDDGPLVRLRDGDSARDVPLAGAFLADADLSGLDLTGADMSGANLARADLTGATLLGADLRGALLVSAKLDDADFTGANLEDANLQAATGCRVGFGGAQLQRAKLLESDLDEATFVSAELDGADLRAAAIVRSRFMGARLDGVDATGADLRGSELCDVSVVGARFDNADLRGCSITGITGYDRAWWIGTDIRDIAPLGVHLWKRFVGDQNYLVEFRRQGPVAELLYKLWWLTSDCGRSVVRWGICTLIVVVGFACAYTVVDIDYGSHATWLSPLYFSVVTVTTLGYGDVQPASVAAQVVAMAQVVIGYVMLGGLLSILSNKLARRSD